MPRGAWCPLLGALAACRHMRVWLGAERDAHVAWSRGVATALLGGPPWDIRRDLPAIFFPKTSAPTEVFGVKTRYLEGSVGARQRALILWRVPGPVLHVVCLT